MKKSTLDVLFLMLWTSIFTRDWASFVNGEHGVTFHILLALELVQIYRMLRRLS